MATYAASEKRIKDAVTASGVKDSLATLIIDTLVAMGKALRRSTPNRLAMSADQVHTVLATELQKYKDSMPIMNPLLSMPGFDVYKDTPVEPLHTHLLSIVKYFWAQTVWTLEKNKQLLLFQTRLNSLEASGLDIPNIMADYMCRYRGGLIEKHFKTISQVMVFAVAGLVSEDLKNTWLAISRLTVLIWETDIRDVHEYLVRVPSHRYLYCQCHILTSCICAAQSGRGYSGHSRLRCNFVPWHTHHKDQVSHYTPLRRERLSVWIGSALLHRALRVLQLSLSLMFYT